ncbi:MAG TPA: response regulator, partial [Phnomibacter sp.]|nr:response regulator [Phnomibacter sp.]
MANNSTILIVEDDAAVASLLHKGLTEAGYQITVAFDGISGLNLARQQSAHLVLLDVMLPGKTGIEICQTLRQEGVVTPILMLTALGKTEQIVQGLDAGADDYMVKPFKL